MCLALLKESSCYVVCIILGAKLVSTNGCGLTECGLLVDFMVYVGDIMLFLLYQCISFCSITIRAAYTDDEPR